VVLILLVFFLMLLSIVLFLLSGGFCSRMFMVYLGFRWVLLLDGWLSLVMIFRIVDLLVLFGLILIVGW